MNPGTPLTILNRVQNDLRGGSSLKGIYGDKKSASEETLIGGICIEFQLCFPLILPFVTTSCRYKDALTEYGHYFKYIEFAVYCRDHETENYDAFRQIFAGQL